MPRNGALRTSLTLILKPPYTTLCLDVTGFGKARHVHRACQIGLATSCAKALTYAAEKHGVHQTRLYRTGLSVGRPQRKDTH